MGSTYVSYGDRGFEASDSALEIWLALLVREIDALSDIPDWLREVREEWHLQATAAFGFGVMPGLDRFATSGEKRQSLIAIASRALHALEGYGPVITREQLNAIAGAGEDAAFTQDAPTSELIRPARYFIKLLEGTLEPWETDSRFEQHTPAQP